MDVLWKLLGFVGLRRPSRATVEVVTKVDPDRAWITSVWRSFFLRKLGISVAGAIPAAGSAVEYFALGAPAAAVILLIVGAGTVVILWTVRVHVISRVAADLKFQDFANALREDIDDVLNDATALEYDQLHDRVCDRIAEVFRALFNGNGGRVNCAIRLAEFDGTRYLFRTHGRSSGMDARRRKSSQPIFADEGIAKEVMGKCPDAWALVVPDVEKAILSGEWKRTAADGYGDVKSALVAPIARAPKDGEIQHLGLLFLTSDQAETFSECHALPLRAVADILAMVYPSITFRVDQSRPRRKHGGRNDGPDSADAAPAPKRASARRRKGGEGDGGA